MADPKHVTPEYIKRIQAIRHRNIMTRAGKALIFSEVPMIDLLTKKLIPTQMQHAILKIYPKMQGTDHEKFISAFNIAAAVFINNGYQRAGSIILTGKGMRNNTRHRLEVDASWKRSRYDALVSRLWSGYISRRIAEIDAAKRPPVKQVARKA